MTNKITEFIDTRKHGKFHTQLVFLGIFLITFTGYGATAYGSIIPMLFGEWKNLNSDVLGYIGSLSEFGSLFGALFFSSFTKKYGIKRVLITATMVFCLATFGQALAPSITVLAVLRTIAGFGFGGVIPLVISLLSEYSPKTNKAQAVASALCGNQYGAIIASFVAIYVTAQLQWRPVFWMALIPVFFLPYIIKNLPESSLYMMKTNDVAGLKAVLSKIDPGFASEIDVEAELAEADLSEDVHKVSYKKLFTKEYAIVTILSSIIAIMGLLFINGVIIWLPSLMVEAGYELGSSLAFTIFLCGGTVAGAMFWARVADKKGFTILLPTIYILGSLSLMLMGIKSNIIILYIFVTLVGFFLFAAHSLVNAFIAQHYPDSLRTTAVGLPNSLGRIGGLLGPTLGGLLMANNVSVLGWFMVFAGMGLVAGISFIIINLHNKKA